MSTSQLEKFTAAKAEFLKDARNLPVKDGYIYGLAALDRQLVSASSSIMLFTFTLQKGSNFADGDRG